MSTKKMKNIRGRIDEVDTRLLYLFNQRAELVLEMARAKVSEGRKLYDPKRERDIFVRITEKNPGPLAPEAIVRLFERIIDESRRLERTEVYDKAPKKS
ncbi:MAG: chorismate mutase [Candidatus Zixiibacteriota bacterium]